jgi:photosystem II stability/assembly factor-like uncharacterized protein
MPHYYRPADFLFAVTIAFLLSCSQHAFSQEELRVDSETVAIVDSPWETIKVETTSSLRGLHVVDANTIWASGSEGTVLLSNDGGESWLVRQIKGAEELDIRDIHGFDEGTAIATTAGTPAIVYRTTNGGRTWKPCGTKTGAFFDSISFWNDRVGVLMSDPIDGKFWIARTKNGGKSWKAIPIANRIEALEGEAGFAASGTNMQTIGGNKCFIGLGGAANGNQYQSSRMLISNDQASTFSIANVPIGRSETSGIFSVYFVDDQSGVAIGGDYKDEDNDTNNYATTSDGGRTWSTPSPRFPPSGYRSCVAGWRQGGEIALVAVGTSGTDMSTDLGSKWHRISNKGFNSVGFSKDGAVGWAVGPKGVVAKWVRQSISQSKE